MSEYVRIGVIGTGVARVTHIPSLISHPRAKVVAVCARNQERAQKVADTFEIPQVFANY